MTVTLTPHAQQLLEQQLARGGSPEQVVERALEHLAEQEPGASPAAEQAKNLDELFQPVRGLFADGELDFSRNPSTSRAIDLA